MCIRDRLIFTLLLVCYLPALAQNTKIEGTVTDASNSEPLIGVSIIVKGTTTGTVTDLNGNYSLSVPPKGTLIFSYIGYVPQEVAVKNQKNIHVALESDTKSLEEVVVVGASMKKSDLTGAVGSVSSKVLQEKPVTDINQALQGRVAGVLINSARRPDQDASIKVRGINTINGATDPIYVVDGLVMDNYGGGFKSINLNDVASIEVLKDASATALYGSRAANGVILVTTKKGKKGEGKVSYDGWVGTRTYAKMPAQMNSRQLFELRKDAAINAYKARFPQYTESQFETFMNDRVMTPYVSGQLGSGFVYAQYELDAYNDPNFKDYDWLGEVTQNASEQNHSLNFSGANDAGSYYMSFGYSDKKGLVKNLGEKTYTGRINVDYNIKKWLKVGTNTQFVRSDAEVFDDDQVFSNARGANPTLPISNELTLNWGGFYDQNYFNPLNTLRIENDRRRNRLISSNFLNINPLKGLNFRSTFSLNYAEESGFRYVPNDIQQAIRYAHHGEATHTRDNRTNWQWDNTVSYDNTFGKHRVNALLGASASKTDRDYTMARSKGFSDNMFSYYNLGASNFIDSREVGSDFSGSALLGYIARANYSYADKYYLTATARLDGSSKFAPGYRWGLFPSISAAWNVTEEGFMKDQTFFDQMKVRVGYGSVGNQEIADYAFLNLYNASVQKGSTTYVSTERIGTQDISWESQQQYNLGVDMTCWNNRIRFSADAFYILNDNLLMVKDHFESTGYKKRVENIGSIENKGMEFSVDVNAVKTKDFQWNVSANISFDKNKVTKMYGHKTFIYNYDGDRNLQKEGNLFIGQPRNTIFIWRTGGIAQAEDMEQLNKIDWAGRSVNPGDLYPLDVAGPNGSGPDGKIDNLDDRVIVGSPDPKFYGGFATDVTYKGISLNAVFNYSYGAKKLSYIYESMTGSNGRGLASLDLLDRWTPENTDAKFPRPFMNDPMDGGSTSYTGTNSYNTFSASNMDRSVQDASYLRLSTLTLSYTLPAKVISLIKLSNLRLYATGSNLFCLTPYKGFDPETGDWYPPTKMFVAGINVSF
jgi:TonB-linked SusC/RagA family outer membrane protein